MRSVRVRLPAPCPRSPTAEAADSKPAQCESTEIRHILTRLLGEAISTNRISEIKAEMENAAEARQLELTLAERRATAELTELADLEVHAVAKNVRWSNADVRLLTRLCIEYRFSNDMQELVERFAAKAESQRSTRALSDQARKSAHELVAEMGHGSKQVCVKNTDKLNGLTYVAAKLREKDPL